MSNELAEARKRVLWGAVCIACLFVGVMVFDRRLTWLDYLSALSAIATLAGLAITLLQVIELERQTRDLTIIVRETKEQVFRNLKMVDTVVCREAIREAESWFRQKEYVASRLKLEAVRSSLIRLMEGTDLALTQERVELEGIVESLTKHIPSLQGMTEAKRGRELDYLSQTCMALTKILEAIEHRNQERG